MSFPLQRYHFSFQTVFFKKCISCTKFCINKFDHNFKKEDKFLHLYLSLPLAFLFLLSSHSQSQSISVSPDSFTINLFTGQTLQEQMTISNLGTGNLEFKIYLDFNTNHEGNNFALKFDGQDDIVEIADHPVFDITDEYTIELWIYPISYTFWGRILAKYHATSWSLNWYSSEQYLTWEANIGGYHLHHNFSSTLDLTEWYHIAVTFDSSLPNSQIKEYINGQINQVHSHSGQLSTDDFPLTIGGGDNPQRFFNGIIDDVRIWDIARTQEEIQAKMNIELTGCEPGLVGYWKFNEGLGNRAFDSSPYQNDGDLLGGVQWINSNTPIVPNWLSINPDSGNIIPGSSIYPVVKFNAFGLEDGNYSSTIIINSNDPITPQVSIPVNLQINSAPDILTSADTLDFGGHFVGTIVEKSLFISNRGFDPLIVSDIVSTHSDYSVNINNFNLNPFESQEVIVTFIPGSVGSFPGNLIIFSNDPDEPTYPVSLFGEGLIPPSISVSPNSLSENLLSGKTSVHTLTINNSGGSDLNFDIRIGNIQGARRLLRQTIANEWPEKQPADTVPEEIQRQSFKDYCPNGNFSSMQNNNQGNESIILSTLLTAFDLRILLLTSRDYPTEIQGYLQAFSDISEVDIFDAYSANPTISNLLNYDAVIVMNNPPFGNPVGLGDVLADYADAGGGIILTAATYVSGWEVQGRLLNEGYIPFNIGSGPVGFANLGNYNASHPIMAGVTAATGDLLGDVTLASGAELIAEWSNGLPFVATKGRNVAAVNIFVTNPGHWTGDIPEILHNGVCWSVGAVWLSAEPTSGIVPANSSMAIDITFDADGMNGGSYNADIIIDNNDPITPEVTVPAQLSVTDAPAISVETDTIDFGEVFLGVSDTLLLVVENKGSMDLLIFSAAVQPAEYSVYPPFAGIDPGETEEFTITFLSQVVGHYPGTLTFANNDPELGNYQVILSGKGVEPPVIMVTPSFLSQTLGLNQTANQVITISNVGGSSLYFNITSGGDDHNYALQFDGFDDYVEVEDNPDLSAIGSTFTIEFWIKIDQLPTTYQEVMGKWGIGFTEDDEYNVDISPTGIIEVHISGNSGQTISAVVKSVNPILPQTWTHKAAVFDANLSSLILYTDGILDNSSNTNTIILDRDTNQPFRIGTYDFTFFPNFQGVIEEVRIWNISRSQGEIKSDMSRRISGMEPGLIGYWPFNEGRGNITYDITSNNNDGLLNGGISWINSAAPIMPSWLSVNPDSGNCLPANSSDIIVAFNTVDLDTGEYFANLNINTNDPILPQVTIPVNLLVSYTVGLNHHSQIPKEYKLYQNYPNPFNPSTTMEFDLPKTGEVTLKIFNILGERVTTLVSERLSAGSYSYDWDASNLASGVYLYRLEAEGFVETKKMILMR